MEDKIMYLPKNMPEDVKFVKQEEWNMYKFVDVVRDNGIQYHYSSPIIGLSTKTGVTWCILMMLKRIYFLNFFSYVYYGTEIKEIYDKTHRQMLHLNRYYNMVKENRLLPRK